MPLTVERVLGLTPRVTAALLAGWAAEAAALWLAAARGLLPRPALGALVSAMAAWLAAVVLVLALDELREAVADAEEKGEPVPDQRGWRRPYGPLLALAAGLAFGAAAWR